MSLRFIHIDRQNDLRVSSFYAVIVKIEDEASFPASIYV